MFKILQKTFSEGIATVPYPDAAPSVCDQFRGRPEFDFAAWRDARPAAAACPTGAIAIADRDGRRDVTVDYGLCVFCGQCAGEGVSITRDFELATADRAALVHRAEYALDADGAHRELLGAARGASSAQARDAIHKVLGRAVAIPPGD